jgi:acyl-CoA reductase-like NAD-dependent aldehyde dehydrogenase
LIISVGHDVVEKPPFLMERSEAKVIHVNFSPASVDDVYFPNHEVIGDIAFSIASLTEALQAQPHWDLTKFMWAKGQNDLKMARTRGSMAFPLLPQKVVADVRAAMPSDGIVCLDNGMYKLWFARYYPVHLPNTLLLDNALATMGAGLPSAIAARLVHPEARVLAVCGDGGFMMNSQEIETAVRLGLNLVVVILNDSGYGMIKWKQSAMKFASWGLDFANPDFVALAAAYGASGHRVENASELRGKLELCLNSPGVHIIDVPIDYGDNNRLVDDLDVTGVPVNTEVKGGPTMNIDIGSSAKLEVFSPYARNKIASLDLAGTQQVSQSLEVARQLFENRENWLAPHQRIAILERLAVLMESAKKSLIATALSEGGKPYADTCIEVERAIQGVKLGIQAVHHLHGEQVPMGLSAASEHRLAFTTVEPIGVVVALSAFNHPLNLVVHQIVPAIAAGCPVIIKPAPATPLSCLAFVQLLHEAGLPKGWCQVLLLDNADAEKLATDKRVGYLSFIGSAKVGWYLRSRLAPGVRCALEHGGSAPVIVDSTANLLEAVPAIVKGGFYHAGQVCVSVQRVFVHQSMLEAFSDLVVAAVNALKVGDPESHDTEVGPLINPREVERVASWVEEALEGGGTLLCGGKKLSDSCYAPTVLLNPPVSAKVSTEEIFGPVICLYSYQDIDQAISQANSLPYSFQAAVFAKDVDIALHAASSLNASSVMVNDHTAFRVDWMPFGGRGASGLGVGGIAHSAREMSNEKLVVFKSSKLA